MTPAELGELNYGLKRCCEGCWSFGLQYERAAENMAHQSSGSSAMQPDSRFDAVSGHACAFKRVSCCAVISWASWVRVVWTADNIEGQGRRVP